MPLPPELDKKIRERFEELKIEAERLSILEADKMALLIEAIDEKKVSLYSRDLSRLKTNFLNLIAILSTKKRNFTEDAKSIRNFSSPTALWGMIIALQEDFENGFFVNLSDIVEVKITNDYLEMAEDLLRGMKKSTSSYSYVSSAVLIGATLEESLRILCQRQNPSISIKKSNGEPKTLNTLIDSLKIDENTGIGLFNELKAKQLRAWADIRNAAAHGEFAKITEQDVELMIAGVKNFLADYM